MNKQKSANRRWVIIGSLIIVGGIVAVLIVGNSNKKPMVSSAKVSTQSITETVLANGNIYPEVEVKISSEVSGEIVELLVKEGDSVRVGQLLLRINPDISESNVERAKASVNNARANYAATEARMQQAESRKKLAEQNYLRNKKLFAEKVIPAAEFETSLTEFETAKGEADAAFRSLEAAKYTVKSLESTLSVEAKTLQRTSIYAPTSGIVSKLNVEKGERVVGTIQMTGTELLRIADLSSMELRVEVSENDIIRVNVGDTASIEVDAYDKRTFLGVVKEVANSSRASSTSTGTSSDQVANFMVKISILKSSYQDLLTLFPGKVSPFLPGMSGMADIRTALVSDALSVPVEAVTTRNVKDSSGNEKKSEVVFIIANGKVKQQLVSTGIQDSKYIQILTGLKVEDKVVTGPYSLLGITLKDGDEVQEGFDIKAIKNKN